MNLWAIASYSEGDLEITFDEDRILLISDVTMQTVGAGSC